MSLGWFRRPSVFTIEIFENPPTGARQAPMSTKTFTLDREGLAQCYDTSAGVGLSGRSIADIGARKRGLPFWLMPVGCLCVGSVCLVFAARCAWGVGHALGKAPGQMSRAAHAAGAGGPAVSPAMVPSPAAVAVAKPVITVTNYVVEPRPEPVRSAVVTNEYFCKGYVMFSKNDGMVILSDGSGRTPRLTLPVAGFSASKQLSLLWMGSRCRFGGVQCICPPSAAVKNERSVEGDLTPPVIQPAEPQPPFGGIVVTPAVGGVH